jgi:hypothetical protein
MPNFHVYTDVDIEIDEFVDDLTPLEVEELIDYLKEEGYLKNNDLKFLINNSENLNDNMWFETCGKLLNNRLQLTNEEQEMIEKISQRFI